MRECVAKLCYLLAKLLDAIVLAENSRRIVSRHGHRELVTAVLTEHPVYLIHSLTENCNVKTYRVANLVGSLSCDLGKLCRADTSCRNSGLCAVCARLDSRHCASKTELEGVGARYDKRNLICAADLCAYSCNKRSNLVGSTNARRLADSDHRCAALDSRADLCRESFKLTAESILSDKFNLVCVLAALGNGCLNTLDNSRRLLVVNELHLRRRYGSRNLKSLLVCVLHSRSRLLRILGSRKRNSHRNESVLCNCGYGFYKYFLGFVIREFGKLYSVNLGIVKKSSRLHAIFECGSFARLRN